ncbi:hypothetical protein PFISCL1PPCAC_16263, partial [Pristionchus fissidentatus]
FRFYSSGAMKGIHETGAFMKTRRDVRGLQVQDVCLLDPRKQEAFSEVFGIVSAEREMKWPEERETDDNCYLLWITVSLASLELERQPTDKFYSKDGKFAEKYEKLREAYPRCFTVPKQSYEEETFDETILIVGFDAKSHRFFSSSRCGEAFINESVWNKVVNSLMEKGAVFKAKLSNLGPEVKEINYKVVKLYERIDGWEGVDVTAKEHEKDLNVELNCTVAERRDTCYAVDTVPFGLVTYPNKFFLPSQLAFGDCLRVVIYRYKSDSKRDYPSKWQVTKVVRHLPKERDTVKPYDDYYTERRKEKRGYLTYGEETSVVEDSPLSKESFVCEKERREWRNEEVVPTDTSGYSSRGSIPSTSTESKDGAWTTVVITGENRCTWYGSCARTDSIRIYHKLNVHAGEFVRGAFYRVKYTLEEDGHNYAYDMDPVPVNLRDIEIANGQNSLQLWCYSRIVDEDGSSFTVHNEVIGDAILPFSKISEKGMRVGDELETLYCRVKHTGNPIPWMVSNARFFRRQKMNRDERRNVEEERRERRYDGDYEERWENVRRRDERNEKLSMKFDNYNHRSIIDSEEEAVGGERRPENFVRNDRRVLEMMQHFIKDSTVCKKFYTVSPENCSKVLRILENARNSH